MVPLPSYSGKRLVNERAPVSLLGCSDHSGKAIAVDASDASSAVNVEKAGEDEVGCIDAADASMFHGDLWQIGGTVARWQNLIPSFPWIAPGWRAWGRRDQILQRSAAEPCFRSPKGQTHTI